MIKSSSNDNLEVLIIKKRKRDLTLCNIYSLPCDICDKNVQDYKRCISVFVYCSIECLEKLFMNHLKLCDEGYDSDDDKIMF